MSTSALHQYFKMVTGASPLQFQKHLRLLEALLFAELSGKCPQEVVLVGVVPEVCELGCGLSAAMQTGVETAIGVVLTKLEQLGAPVKMKARPDVPRIWWEKEARTDSLVEGLAHVSGHPG